MSSFEARASDTEAPAGDPTGDIPTASLTMNAPPSAGAISQSTTGNIPGLVNNGSYPMNPMLAALREQEARQFMIAAANANASASNNLLAARPQVPNHNQAYLYEQALMAQRGMYNPMSSFPPQLPPPPPPPPPPAPTVPMPKQTKTSSREEHTEEPSDYKKKSKYEPYFDGSTIPDEESCSDDDAKVMTRRGEEVMEGVTSQMTAKERLNEPFPKKLYRMIDDAKNNGQEDIISFFSHGRAWAIHRPKAFMEEIMPKYMSTSRMTSFQRQLNLYNFKRITEGKDRGGYYHEFFLQGRKGLLKKIKRKKPSAPKCSRHDLDQAARISNAILSTGKYAPTYNRNGMGLMADQMMQQQQQQIAGRPHDEVYANAMRMRNFGSSTDGTTSSPVAGRQQDHLYPQEGIETEASP